MQFFQRKKTSIGLHLHLEENKKQYNVAIIEKINDEVILNDVLENISVDSLRKFKDHANVQLNITGKGVVRKTLSSNENHSFDQEKILIQRLESDAFLYRKDELFKEVDELEQLGIVPKKVYLGTLLSDHFYKLELFSKGKEEEQLVFGNNPYPAGIKEALAASLESHIPNDEILSEDLHYLNEKYERLFYKVRLFNGMKIATLIFSALLGLSMILIFFLNTRIHSVQDMLSSNRPQLIEFRRLNAEIEKKQLLVQQNNWWGSSRISEYLDKTALNIPKGVILDKWDIFSENRNEMVIKGKVQSSVIFNKWIDEIKPLEFIDEDQLTFNYNELNNDEGHDGLFSITAIVDYGNK